jgi:RNA polymerase sigma-70 factor (ECF subfamily)
MPASTDVLGYILMTVRSRCLNYLKRMRLEEDHARRSSELYEWELQARIDTLEDAHYGDIFRTEMEAIVMASLSKLPQQTRRIFILNRLRGMARKDIAAAMNVSQQKVDYHVRKATELLYRALRDFLPLVVLAMESFFVACLGFLVCELFYI